MRKSGPSRGSHLPVLMKLMQKTVGPVVELGCGIYSTHFLHWWCFMEGRRFVTIESNPQYFDYAKQFQKDHHDVLCVNDWGDVDLSEPWSVAFVDHAPDTRRREEILRLTHAEYVVAHDSENRNQHKYRYHTVFDKFKYRRKYDLAYPHTTVFSNTHQLETIF